MDWIKEYQLFLFDFDGLLVNTEEIQFMAYKRMCAGRGVDLKWQFSDYCRVAHYSSEGLRDQIYAQYPELKDQEPSWNVLYSEKKKALADLLNEGAVHPMPGVVKLLTALQDAGIPRCVVTHSPDELVNIARRKNPIFNTIPVWFTRENYSHPKPNPECYLKAIETLAKPTDKVIGFEDSPRGLRALMGTRAKPVLVCPDIYPEIPTFVSAGVTYYPSFESLSL
jgi:haloacid dehalogenase superfamily, subfamily IA, variant 3 with third motif having DD or ED